MKVKVFDKFKTIRVTCEVEWDLDDEDSPYREPKGYVPETVYTVELKASELINDLVMWEDAEADAYVIDMDALADSDYLSDIITDDAGFCHKGFKVLKLTPTDKDAEVIYG